MEQLYPTRKLTWPEAAKLAQKRVEEILHKEVICQMALEDETYWTLYSPTYMFSTQELELLLQAGRATKEVWEEAIPQEGNASRSLGMELTRLLLKRPCTASVPGALHGRGPLATGLSLLRRPKAGPSAAWSLGGLGGVEIPKGTPRLLGKTWPHSLLSHGFLRGIPGEVPQRFMLALPPFPMATTWGRSSFPCRRESSPCPTTGWNAKTTRFSP